MHTIFFVYICGNIGSEPDVCPLILKYITAKTYTMVKIGKYNYLRITRFVEFGAYLSDNDKQLQNKKPEEILLPSKYVPENAVVGDELRVFVYTDSEDRPVATTERPFAQVGEFAYLQAVDVNKYGAFMDWGLQKNLLVPFSEQKMKMRAGGVYLVYVYLDEASKRVVASARIEHFLGNVFPDYHRTQKVNALVIGHTDRGYQVIVNNMHKGMIYDNEIYAPLEIEQNLVAYVKNVRDDGKIDLTLTVPGTLNRVEHLSNAILRMLDENEILPVSDFSSPEEIKEVMHCSKKDFKKAVGALYKNQQIVIDPEGRIHRK